MSAPDGWRAVPVEPTAEQTTAMECFPHAEEGDLGADGWSNHGWHRLSYQAALAAAPDSGLVVLPGWQPIESAPRDGSTIWVARHMGTFGWVVGTSHYMTSSMGMVEGWISRGIGVFGELGLANPTHWATHEPPPPPTTRQDQEVKKP